MIMQESRVKVGAWWLALTLATFWLIWSFYGHILSAPNTVLIAGKGDGLKNSFTYAWHAVHGNSLLHFSGSGYPYGDHIFYTDGHPPLAWLVQLFPALKPWSIGLMNILLILAPLGCAWALFGIGRLWGMQAWSAAIAALCITLLQPQVQRLTGHLALAHCWSFPLVWYLLLRADQAGQRITWSITVGSAILLTLLVHPYLGMMNAMFVAAYLGIRVLLEPRRLRRRRTWIEGVLSVALPLVVFMALLRASDTHADRPDVPPGAAEYATTVASLLVPNYPVVGPWFGALQKEEDLPWEAACYLGLATTIVLSVLLIAWAVRIAKRGRGALRPDAPALHLLAAIIVLLFAMNVWLMLLSEVLPVLEQFRATGRFAWVFFFVCLMFCSARLWQWSATRGARWRPYALAVFCLVQVSYGVEGWIQQRHLGPTIGIWPNSLDASSPDPAFGPLASALRAEGAAAIIPLPHMHGGSERYARSTTEKLLHLSYPVSFLSGAPLMAGNMIRTSFEHTRRLMAITAPATFLKYVAADIHADAKMGLLWSGDALNHDEQSLWWRGRPVLSNEAGELRVITAAELFAWEGGAQRRRFEAGRDHMVERGGLLLSGTSPDTDTLLHYVRSAPGPVMGQVNQFLRALELQGADLDTTRIYEVSVVIDAVDVEAVNAWLILEHDTDDHKVDWEGFRDVRSMPMQLNGRTVATLQVRPRHSDGIYRVVIGGPEDNSSRLVASHALIRPLGVDAWRQSSEGLYLNNVPLDSAAYNPPSLLR